MTINDTSRHKGIDLSWGAGLAVVLAVTVAQSARAADGDAAALTAAAVAPTDIIVTGTRTQRTVADSSVPIDVLDAKQLESTGKLNLRDALQQSIPSYYNASGWTGGTGEAIKSASLRGLRAGRCQCLGLRRCQGGQQ